MPKKLTQAAKIVTLTNALRGLINKPECKAAVDAAQEALRLCADVPQAPVTVPLTANRIIAIFCEEHKRQFGRNPRMDGKDASRAKELSGMFSASESEHFRLVAREYCADTDDWMTGNDKRPAMMWQLKWLNGARVERYETQIAERLYEQELRQTVPAKQAQLDLPGVQY